MRRIIVGTALVGTLFATVAWWRNHRRTGSRFVNDVVNPFLLGVASRADLARISARSSTLDAGRGSGA